MFDETQRKWPELVGKSGEEAVEKVKSDTGMRIEGYLYLEIFSV
jgi:hypothetical protein